MHDKCPVIYTIVSIWIAAFIDTYNYRVLKTNQNNSQPQKMTGYTEDYTENTFESGSKNNFFR